MLLYYRLCIPGYGTGRLGQPQPVKAIPLLSIPLRTLLTVKGASVPPCQAAPTEARYQFFL